MEAPALLGPSPRSGDHLRACLAVPGQALQQPLLVERLPAAGDRNDLSAPRHAEAGVPPPGQPGEPVLLGLDPGPRVHVGRELVVVPVAPVGVLRVLRAEAVLVARVLCGVPGGLLLLVLTGAARRGEVADHLADPHVAELRGSEEVLLGRPEEVVRVGVRWVLLLVLRRPGPLSRRVVRELREDVLHRPRAAHHVKPQQPAAAHAAPDQSGLQVPLHRVLLVARFCLQEGVLFGLHHVLQDVLPRRVGPHVWVEQHHVRRRGGVRRQVQAVRHHAPVVGRVPPAVRDPLVRLVELLLDLLRPGEEEPAGRPVV